MNQKNEQLKNKDELLVKNNWYVQYEDDAKTQIRLLSVYFRFKVDKKEVSLSCLMFADRPNQ